MAGVSISSPGTAALMVEILKPDSSSLGSSGFVFNNGKGFIDTKTLPTAGTYTVLIDPYQDTTGSATVTLYDVPADVTAPVTPGGAAVAVATSTAGQNAQLNLAGMAGQRVFVKALTSGLASVDTAAVTVSLLKPDGSSLGASGYIFNSGKGFIDTMTLPTSGNYTVLVDPYQDTTGTTTVTVFDVPPDTTDSIAPGGAPVAVTSSTAGQNGQLTFSGTAGQRVFLTASTGSLASVDTAAVTVSLLKPDGSSLGSTGYVFANRTKFIDTKTLPTTGTYSVRVDPYQDTTGTTTVTLTDVPPDVGDAVAIGGPAVRVSLSVGQNALLPFSGAAGQTIRFERSAITIPLGYYRILKPDGTTLASSGITGTSDASLDADLPVTGQYKVLIDPVDDKTGSATVRLAVRGDAPSNLADVSSSGTLPVFRAQPVSGATQYQFQVATTPPLRVW